MSFYTFSQNNCGVLIGPEYIIIEADSSDDANEIAEEHGIYFNGCQTGDDCGCCGDRWAQATKYDATEKPEIYSEDPAEYLNWCGEKPEVKIVRKTVTF